MKPRNKLKLFLLILILGSCSEKSFLLTKKEIDSNYNPFYNKGYEFYEIYFGLKPSLRPSFFEEYTRHLHNMVFRLNMKMVQTKEGTGTNLQFKSPYHIHLLIDDLSVLSGLGREDFMKFDHGMNRDGMYLSVSEYDEFSKFIKKVEVSLENLTEYKCINCSEVQLGFMHISRLEVLESYVRYSPKKRIEYLYISSHNNLPNGVLRLMKLDLDAIANTKTPNFFTPFGVNKKALEKAKGIWLDNFK